MIILPSGTTPPAFDISSLRATSGTAFYPLPSSSGFGGSSPSGMSSYIIPSVLIVGGLYMIYTSGNRK